MMGHRVLTDDQARDMRVAAADGVRPVDLAVQYGVSLQVVSNVLHGRRYAHAGGPIRVGGAKYTLADAPPSALDTLTNTTLED